jgi:hypothetical protein
MDGFDKGQRERLEQEIRERHRDLVQQFEFGCLNQLSSMGTRPPAQPPADAFTASGKSRFDVEKFAAIDTTAEVVEEPKGLILPPESEGE